MKIADVREEKGKEGIAQLHHVAKILSQVRHPHVMRLYEVLQVGLVYGENLLTNQSIEFEFVKQNLEFPCFNILGL